MAWTNSRNKQLVERARRVIPGGMYGHQSTAVLPEVFPQFFRRAEGARLWDADGNEYIDYMCGFGPNLLGYRHPSVEAAAAAQQQLGDTMTGPSEIMVGLAEKFVSLVTHADWVIFCKNGTDATTMAMTTARAHTRKRKILVGEGLSWRRAVVQSERERHPARGSRPYSALRVQQSGQSYRSFPNRWR